MLITQRNQCIKSKNFTFDLVKLQTRDLFSVASARSSHRPSPELFDRYPRWASKVNVGALPKKIHKKRELYSFLQPSFSY